MINKFIGIGNLTKDPEIQRTATYTLCNFTIAVNNPVIKKEVLFIDAVAWNKMAENCSKYLKKGSRVFIDGRLKTDTWKSSGGQSRNKIILVAESVRFLPGGSESEKNLSDVEKNNPTDSIENSTPAEDDLEIDQEELDQIPF